MMRFVRHVLAATALGCASMVAVAGDDCCGVVSPRFVAVPTYVPSYACTEPAPPSRYPPVHIPDPFGCDSPYCAPTPPYGGDPYRGDPYRREPIPLPAPPTGYGTFPYGAQPYGNPPYNPSPFGSPPGGGPLTPGTHPPGGRKGPIISQSSTLGGATQYLEPPAERCKVSFWNQTGSDVTLVVGDRTSRVQRDRAVVLSLPGEFSWKTETSVDKREQVSSDLNYFDVVIR